MNYSNEIIWALEGLENGDLADEIPGAGDLIARGGKLAERTAAKLDAVREYIIVGGTAPTIPDAWWRAIGIVIARLSAEMADKSEDAVAAESAFRKHLADVVAQDDDVVHYHLVGWRM